MTEASNSSNNRRQFTRVHVQLDVSIKPSEQATINGLARDLSLKGVYIPCQTRLPEDTNVNITLSWHHDDSLSLDLEGVIARVDEEGMAVEFAQIPLEVFEILRNLIRYNAVDSARIDEEFSQNLGIKPDST